MSTTKNIENNQTAVAAVVKEQLAVNSPLPTTLEDMPNELFMEIFDLFDWYSLYFSFSWLNSRFDIVLAEYHTIQVDLDCIPTNKIMSHLGRHLFSLDPHRITTLRSSIKRHTELVLYDDLTWDHFSYIRSLILININSKATALLSNNRIYRLRMHIVYLFLSFIIPNSSGVCLSVYPKLQRCLLSNATFSPNIIYLQSNTVQHLQIYQLQSQIDIVATDLLVHSAHLRRLDLHVMPDVINPERVSHFIRPSSPSSSTLTHLTIQSSLLYFSSIEWLLAYTPCLRIFHVRATSSCERMINPSEWEQVLSSEIKRLDLKIAVTKPGTLPLEILKNDQFWQSRKWHVESFIDPSPSLHMHS